MNKLNQAMNIIDAVTNKMDEDKALIAKLENNGLYRNRDDDLKERRSGFKGVSRRNDAWDMGDGGLSLTAVISRRV